MMSARVHIRANGVKPDPIVAECDLSSHRFGDGGGRSVHVYGCGKTEAEARRNLVEHAKAIRIELGLLVDNEAQNADCPRCKGSGWLEAIEGSDGSYVTSRPCHCDNRSVLRW